MIIISCRGWTHLHMARAKARPKRGKNKGSIIGSYKSTLIKIIKQINSL